MCGVLPCSLVAGSAWGAYVASWVLSSCGTTLRRPRLLLLPSVKLRSEALDEVRRRPDVRGALTGDTVTVPLPAPFAAF